MEINAIINLGSLDMYNGPSQVQSIKPESQSTTDIFWGHTDA